MNILLVDQFSEMGGAQHGLLDLTSGMRRKGWRIAAALAGDGPLHGKLRELGVPTATIPCGPYASWRKSPGDYLRFPLDTLRMTVRLRRLAELYAADVIYANGPRVALAASWSRLPMLFHAHSRLAEGAQLNVLRHALRAATVVATCEFLATPLRGFSAPLIVPNGTTDVGFRVLPVDSQLRVGVVGRIAPEKGQLDFIRAAAILRDLDCRFIICGDAVLADPRYAEAVRSEASDLPVEFTGWRGTPAEALGEVDVLVVPSAAHEATPRVILEAFSAGVPVVAYASGGIPELIDDNRTGFLITDRTPQAMAKRLRTLLADRPRLTKAAQNARQEWQGRYTLKAFQDQMLTLLETTVRRSRSQNMSEASTAPADAPFNKGE